MKMVNKFYNVSQILPGDVIVADTMAIVLSVRLTLKYYEITFLENNEVWMFPYHSRTSLPVLQR